jgi:dTMP kinase
MLIVFEGIDGSGKTTAAKHFAGAIRATYTREPTDGVYGKLIRQAASLGHRLVDELGAFIADRREHVYWLNTTTELYRGLPGEIVVMDRYYHSNAVYQATNDRSPLDIVAMNDFAPVPDLTFVFDIAPERAYERLERRGQLTAFESVSGLERARELYLTLAEDLRQAGHNIVVIDADTTPAEINVAVVRHAFDVVKPLIPAWRNLTHESWLCPL